ncbi:hypothetical protein [Actinomadura sp. 7K507]|uniref:hypothetical protein n=1 Tax=Actinomadura sp. 7K507 TaxID=2530365 RepID=UPI0010440B3B|nr:hypothetical protein [Actinomadura sp. 7K507]TDC93076.1 hypothetical protein E1285_10620 [Actinomadura sp. 7K507]
MTWRRAAGTLTYAWKRAEWPIAEPASRILQGLLAALLRLDGPAAESLARWVPDEVLLLENVAAFLRRWRCNGPSSSPSQS